MNDQTLKNFLSEADQSIARPAIRSNLHDRVFVRLRRRRATRRGAALALVMIAFLPLLHSQHPIPKTPSKLPIAVAPTAKPSPWDAIVERRTAEAILRLQDRQATVRSIPMDPIQRLQMESDATAATLLAAGDHFARDPASTRQGVENYQRVKTYFPKTPWAVQADRRLSQIRS